eukprot:Sspe_Gene.117395::Locus_108527_Transcript_1_1_Confidence_1.000_Length_479::g.117395::m.117395
MSDVNMLELPEVQGIIFAGLALVVAIGGYTLVGHRFSLLAPLAIPIGYLLLLATELLLVWVGGGVNSLGLGRRAPGVVNFLNNLLTLFDPSKIKALDVVLAGLLVLLNFGFSQMVQALTNMQHTIEYVKSQE